jgi:hypothetical protein
MISSALVAVVPSMNAEALSLVRFSIVRFGGYGKSAGNSEGLLSVDVAAVEVVDDVAAADELVDVGALLVGVAAEVVTAALGVDGLADGVPLVSSEQLTSATASAPTTSNHEIRRLMLRR